MAKKEQNIEFKEPNWMIIGLLIIVIILQLLIKFPIQINIDKTITDCPEIICQEVICKTTIEVINKTIVEQKFTDIIKWPNWEIYQYNASTLK